MLPITTSKVTSNHEEIRRWAEARGAKPAAVMGAESDGAAGIIRLDFPGQSDDGPLEEIGWDEWFSKLDRHNLALLYQEHTAGGENSSFNQIVSRETAEEAHHAVGGKGRSAAHKRPEKTTRKVSAPRPHGEAASEHREEIVRVGAVRKPRTPVSARGRAARSGNAAQKRSAGSSPASASLEELARN